VSIVSLELGRQAGDPGDVPFIVPREISLGMIPA
jgi:hypothetical protein